MSRKIYKEIKAKFKRHRTKFRPAENLDCRYRSYAKCVHGTKTLALPTQDNGWLSAPPTEPCNYHDNHSPQRPDSDG